MSRGASQQFGVDAASTGDSALQNSPTHGTRKVVRFSATERAFHWTFAIPFLGLLLSGLPLSFPVLRSWITDYSPQIGVRLHLVCGVAWLLGPALVVIIGDRRALTRAASDLFVIVRQELSWLRQLPRLLTGLACEMRGVGRFNAGQKLNGSFVAVTSVFFAVTGVILWIVRQSPASGSTGGLLGQVVVAWSRRLHYLLTILMLAPLLGHIGLAAIHPRTKESLRGMLFGAVDADWARDHHPVWYSEISRGPSSLAEDAAVDAPSSQPRTSLRKS